MIGFIFFLIIVSIITLCFTDDDKTEKEISLNDINVNDEIRVKGESFIVKAYSSDGNVEIVNLNNKLSYIIKIDENTKLTSHSENGTRKYITIDNFEGTVSGQYLNRIKFK